jgi:hypothetical protein
VADTGPSREQLVRELAAVSHASWLRQKVRDQGADPATLPPGVTAHDIERAEDIVARLVELGVVEY